MQQPCHWHLCFMWNCVKFTWTSVTNMISEPYQRHDFKHILCSHRDNRLLWDKKCSDFCWLNSYYKIFTYSYTLYCLQCFDAVGWASEEHPACKNWLMRCWHGYLSGARCKWYAYGQADATSTRLSLASLKFRMVSPFCYRLTQFVLYRVTR